jgi:hypothetical protein
MSRLSLHGAVRRCSRHSERHPVPAASLRDEVYPTGNGRQLPRILCLGVRAGVADITEVA